MRIDLREQREERKRRGVSQRQRRKERQARICDFIAKSTADRGFPPTLAEIAIAMGLKSKSAALDLVNRMEARGLIERAGGKKRSARGIWVVGAPKPEPLVSPGVAVPALLLFPCLPHGNHAAYPYDTSHNTRSSTSGSDTPGRGSSRASASTSSPWAPCAVTLHSCACTVLRAAAMRWSELAAARPR